MYKFLYLWMFWVILQVLSTCLSSAEAIHSGMPIIYDAIDTSLWEFNPETGKADLLLDFDAPVGSISLISFRADRQSVIYLHLPPSHERGISRFEMLERNIQTGMEYSIMKAQWILSYELPSRDARLIQLVEGDESRYCILYFLPMVCEPAPPALVQLITSASIIWQNNAGYALIERALYRFHLDSLSWELILENEWILARSAAYEPETNSLYIFGDMRLIESGCRSNQIMRLDLLTLELVFVPIELPNCVSNFHRIQISPDGRYLQYSTRELIVIDMHTGELIYRLHWYSGRAVWLENSQGLLFMSYDQPSGSANRISRFNIMTGEVSLVYQGNVGYVWLYQVS
jgi:hypothetical protein